MSDGFYNWLGNVRVRGEVGSVHRKAIFQNAVTLACEVKRLIDFIEWGKS